MKTKPEKKKGKSACATNPVSTRPIPAPSTPKSRVLVITAKAGTEDREAARVYLAHMPSALVAVDFSKPMAGDLSLMETIGVLREKAEAVNAGDLKEAEALLMSQALALNTIFGELARRAALNMGEYLGSADKYMRLALKAQGQCRATLETLAAIKNPPVLFAKQANIANGPQQVNNGTAAPQPVRAQSATIAQNKLLEAHTGTGLDSGAAAAAIPGNPALASVGAIDGAA